MSAGLAGQTAEDRRLPFRMRPDLVCTEQHIGGSRYWHLRDPVSLRYFQLKPEEYFVLRQLDGRCSLLELRRRFEQRWAPQRLTTQQLQSYLATLHAQGLILSDAARQDRVLAARSIRQAQRQFAAVLASPLAIRVRGIDPEWLLARLAPLTGVFFRPWCVVLCVGLVLTSLLLGVVHSELVLARLPHFGEVFSPHNLVWLMLVMGVTKVLHELGHAVSCRHFGARCSELGLMLLVLTPCLYCNVSDAWMLRSRWQRIVISAAGMCVELVLAAAAFLLWLTSVPGVFNSICLNVVLVCSVSTLLFNGNPLLRYDGYYILSDLVELPNLRQQAETLFRNLLCRFYCDTELPDQRLLPERLRGPLLLWYAGAAVYRVVMVWGILWFVDALLEPLGLQPLAFAIAVMTVTGMILPPLRGLRRLFQSPSWSRSVDRVRLVTRGVLTVAVIAAGLLIPLPHSVKSPAVIEAAGATRVYVPREGLLLSAIAVGHEVKVGDELAQLRNPDIERDIARLEGEVAQLKTRLEGFRLRRARDSKAVDALIPATEERLADRERQLASRREDQSRLRLIAPVAGRVLPPPDRPESPGSELSAGSSASSATRLPEWSGTPLDPSNLGAALASGTEFCLVSQDDRFEAVLAIDQRDIEFLRTGQTVDLLLDHAASHSMAGRITEIAEMNLQVVRRELMEHADFPTRIDADGTARPVNTAYLARVELDPSSVPLVLYGTGRARIHAEPTSLGSRLLRFARQTFRLR